MKILIIGGTHFVGRHLAGTALARGHELTLFNRGQSSAGLFSEAEHLCGDRDGDGLNVLKDRTWDAVIDTCGYVPRVVTQSAALLAGSVSRYVFISSVSVYSDFSQIGLDESGPLGTLKDPAVEEINGETYGPLKVLCEQAVEEALPGRALIIRPGFIVGPYDPTDRFTYWPRRVNLGGDVLAPGTSSQPVQVIDARDLADWTIRMMEQSATGIYNATGPDYTLTLGEILETCRTVSGSDARFEWVPDAFLKENDADSTRLLPFYIPSSSDSAGMMTASIAKAVAAGLTFRPLADTVRETLAWDRTRPADEPLKVGLSLERERDLLEKYAAQEGTSE
jgi:2'-hydroxyisoflavone reductase